MNSTVTPILQVENLFAGYTDEDVLHDVSVAVPRGKIVAVIGPNGSGKSTLLKSIYGLVPRRRGRIRLLRADSTSDDLVRLRPHAVSRRGVNMVPQLQNVFPDMSVAENLDMGALPLTPGERADRERVLGWFPMLATMLRKRAATLSGGQRQMLGIARALMSDPTLLLLDEPSAGLSPAVVDEVFGKVKAINEAGVSVLMVEQKARQCLAIADVGYVLDQGENRLTGSGAELLGNNEVIQLYLGGGGRLAALARSQGAHPEKPGAAAADPGRAGA